VMPSSPRFDNFLILKQKFCLSANASTSKQYWPGSSQSEGTRSTTATVDLLSASLIEKVLEVTVRSQKRGHGLEALMRKGGEKS